MKQVQKRYLYSALLAVLFFIIIYALLRINLIISIILTLLVYFGGILVFKKEDIRDFKEEYINNYYYMASKANNAAINTENDKIKEDVEKISKLTDQIIVSLSQRPKKVEQVFDFFDYYLDITYKILYKYNIINKKEEKTKEEKSYLKSTPGNITKILEAFNKQYKNMQEAKILDIDTEIKMFETSSGITNENVKVGDDNE